MPLRAGHRLRLAETRFTNHSFSFYFLFTIFYSFTYGIEVPNGGWWRVESQLKGQLEIGHLVDLDELERNFQVNKSTGDWKELTIARFLSRRGCKLFNQLHIYFINDCSFIINLASRRDIMSSIP